MISFIICLAILVGGYFTYGKFVDNTFGPDDRETPAVAINDGIDYVVMPQWKLFLVELLNIAGLGPIFGALQGALWGPLVFLWITFGTIFAGAVHDYFSGMLSERNNGDSIAEVSGIYLGDGMKQVMRFFSVVLLIMVGTVFAVGPTGLIITLLTNKGVTGTFAKPVVWLTIIMAYYFIATFLSIDKIIGKIYPIFGICLILMAIGVAIGLPAHGYSTPELWSHFYNMHPAKTPIWSFMFITVACGAISGFHSTQAPLMARCLKSERQGHFVFYGAMVAEGIIALIWAAAGVSLYKVTGGLNTGLAEALANGQSAAIYDVSVKTMGKVGVVLAMIGVVVCPITSGDTAFRSARLTLSDWMKFDQGPKLHRLALCVPVLGVGCILGFGNVFGVIDYTVIWRYFSWTNQTLAMIVLWSASMFLASQKKNYWITAVPATFMSAVSATYFTMAPECLGMIKALTYNTKVAYPVGIIVAVVFLVIFLKAAKNAPETVTAREAAARA
ncbi:MAG: carbon starvation CstA family protein [Eubacteriales bacterium]|nr:carbon starvation CstA family protein [Eubacteriales bacterium]